MSEKFWCGTLYASNPHSVASRQIARLSSSRMSVPKRTKHSALPPDCQRSLKSLRLHTCAKILPATGSYPQSVVYPSRFARERLATSSRVRRCSLSWPSLPMYDRIHGTKPAAINALTARTCLAGMYPSTRPSSNQLWKSRAMGVSSEA